MTNISKRMLKKEQRDALYTQFIQLFSSSKKQGGEIFASIFSETERIMFIKRLAIIVLIGKGISHYVIAREVKASTSTVHAIAEQIEAGMYAPILQHIQKKSFNSEKFFKTIEWILLGGGIMPARSKEGWKRAYGMETPYKIKKKR